MDNDKRKITERLFSILSKKIDRIPLNEGEFVTTLSFCIQVGFYDGDICYLTDIYPHQLEINKIEVKTR